jgi:hypothetical protein
MVVPWASGRIAADGSGGPHRSVIAARRVLPPRLVLRRVVERRLAVDPQTALALTDLAYRRLGRRAYAIRAACFLVALAAPAALTPRELRHRALLSFVGPLLHTPAALNAYGGGRDRLLADPCGGLQRDAPGRLR